MKKLKNIIKTLATVKIKDFLLLLITISLLKIAFYGTDVNIKTKRFDNRIPVAVSTDDSITIDTLSPIEVNIEKEQ